MAGIPGYPVSAVVTFELFCVPLLRAWQALRPPEPVMVDAVLTRKCVSPAGDDEYVRVSVGQVGDRLVASPLSGGAGVITSLRADRAGQKYIRLSPHFYNTDDELRRVLELI